MAQRRIRDQLRVNLKRKCASVPERIWMERKFGSLLTVFLLAYQFRTADLHFWRQGGPLNSQDVGYSCSANSINFFLNLL